jgi:hypothetical protein
LCATVNEESTTLFQIQNRTRAAKLTAINEYKQASKQGKVPVYKDRHRSVQDSRKFYKRLIYTRKPFEPAEAIC